MLDASELERVRVEIGALLLDRLPDAAQREALLRELLDGCQRDHVSNKRGPKPMPLDGLAKFKLWYKIRRDLIEAHGLKNESQEVSAMRVGAHLGFKMPDKRGSQGSLLRLIRIANGGEPDVTKRAKQMRDSMSDEGYRLLSDRIAAL